MMRLDLLLATAMNMQRAFSLNVIRILTTIVCVACLVGTPLLQSCADSSSDSSDYEGDEGSEYSSYTSEYEEESGFADGDYCAQVKYYNPSTRHAAVYTLNVKLRDNRLVEIYWPNGGWYDNTHFSPADIEDGDAEFVSDRNVEYRVVILGERGSRVVDNQALSEREFLERIEQQSTQQEQEYYYYDTEPSESDDGTWQDDGSYNEDE